MLNLRDIKYSHEKGVWLNITQLSSLVNSSYSDKPSLKIQMLAVTNVRGK